MSMPIASTENVFVGLVTSETAMYVKVFMNLILYSYMFIKLFSPVKMVHLNQLDKVFNII